MSNSRRYSTYAATLAAGDRLDIQRQGDYVAILSATADIQIGFDDEPGGSGFQGLKISSAETFQKVSIINPTGAPNTILVAIGRGDLADGRLAVTAPLNIVDMAALRGDVQAVDAAVDVAAGRLLSGGQSAADWLADIAAPMPIMGASFAAWHAHSSTAVLQLVNPASNTGGLIIRSMTATCQTANQTLKIYADTAAPSASTDVSKRVIFAWRAQIDRDYLGHPLLLPAGYGIWLANPGINSDGCINYDLV